MNKKIYITVDMETPQTPFREGMLRESLFDHEFEYGAILNICHFYHIPATFFLNIYEEHFWGHGFFTEKCEQILMKGCDIQLHTHPFWQYDKNRINMYEYSLDEQKEIISAGKIRLQELTGEKVEIHRAGAYGADINTLHALRENGIYMDSSFFYDHKNCKLNQYSNQQLIDTGIQQIEVLTFERGLKYDNNVVKLDIDWMDLCELFTAMHVIINNNLNDIILFLHSSSFIKINGAYTKFELDYYKIFKFAAAIEYLIKNGYEFSLIKNADTKNIEKSWEHLQIKLGKVSFQYHEIKVDKIQNEDSNYEIINKFKNYIKANKSDIKRQIMKDRLYHMMYDSAMSYDAANKFYHLLRGF